MPLETNVATFACSGRRNSWLCFAAGRKPLKTTFISTSKLNYLKNLIAMQNDYYEDPRLQAAAEREDFERENDNAVPQTKYAKRRRMLEKDDWYSILDSERED